MIIARISVIDDSVKMLKRARWKCINCGKLCCALGAPNLSRQDMARLEKAERMKKYFVPMKNKTAYNLTDFSLKAKKGGECIFQKYRDKKSRCLIHKFRPALCEMFPFHFERKGATVFVHFLPCEGIGKGDVITEEFIRDLYLKHRKIIVK